MGLINLLTTIGLPSFGDLGEVTIKYKWICNIIEWLINFVGDVGLGIIVFTLCLKLITLPLDIFSRASMKKNSLKMELMKDDLQKLQKQYANNQQLYQQKMMALYKKNGYSAFSACLPTIVTLVFFIIVIGAFNSYTRVADKQVFNEMGIAYDEAIESFVGDDENTSVLVKGEGSKAFVININKALEEKGYEVIFKEGYSANTLNTEIESYKIDFTKLNSSNIFTDYESLKVYFDENGNINKSNQDLTNKINSDCEHYLVTTYLNETEIEKLKGSIVLEQNEKYSIRNSKIVIEKHPTLAKYFDEETGKIKHSVIFEEHAQTNEKFLIESEKFISEQAVKAIVNDYVEDTVKKVAREASAKAYEENSSKSVIFPWVKNLWVVDSPFKRALPSISELETSLGKENMGSLGDETVYNELTYNLGAYKQTGFSKGNGWFILVALSILTMLGSTVIMNKTQKTQMELSTVDGANGQAAMTQKMMTWMMPIMFGVFAFIYSAAFSIYMVTSSILSTGFTLLINFCVERAFKKKLEKEEEEKASKARYGKRR